jgi:hypothetical protein
VAHLDLTPGQSICLTKPSPAWLHEVDLVLLCCVAVAASQSLHSSKIDVEFSLLTLHNTQRPL